MSRTSRVTAEAGAAWRTFLRRRTAVFFTFGFPLILVAIFGIVVQANPAGGGLFGHPTNFYVPGYLAVIVLFTPLSRIGSSLARYREGNRFQKLSTTPARPSEWLAAHTLVNIAIIVLASTVVLGVLELLAGGTIRLSPLLLPFIILAVVIFCGLGAILGRITDSQDGVVAASNAVALPLVFLSETFVMPERLPMWFRPAISLSPLTYFSRGVRNVTYLNQPAGSDLLVLGVFAALVFAVGAYAVPQE
ncbi:ABC transporter permease [Haloarcula sp. H-GB4]|uniref:ABC transporter permease n=1 Tax=Haloarcula sp. H-GB4 TaxID=3069755 RepID=UPI0027AE2959|nr:ABC transporter permease [Haloarcula sp. H-GB4]MDQ2074671.1 ABC transporter permease [Haloarcula sp. H-GB4]